MPAVNNELSPWVREMVSARVPVGDAVRIAVGGSIPEFAKRHGLNRTVAAMAIYGKRTPVPSDVLAALIKELGGAEQEWRELLWLAAKPIPAQPSVAA